MHTIPRGVRSCGHVLHTSQYLYVLVQNQPAKDQPNCCRVSWEYPDTDQPAKGPLCTGHKGIPAKLIVAIFAGLALAPQAFAQVPSPVFDSCVLMESYKAGTYQELGGEATISDDEIPGYSVLSYQHKGISYGYASSARSQGDLLIVGSQRMSILKAKRVGKESPERIDPTQAVYGIVRYKARAYYCVASNFEGLGRSGSLQNIRAAYIAPLTGSSKAPKMSGLYYSVRDIRKIPR